MRSVIGYRLRQYFGQEEELILSAVKCTWG